MRISLIGFGQVGQCYAQALHAAGHTLDTLCDIAPTDAMRERAQSHQAELVTELGPWLARADLVISAVFGHAAQDVAEAALPLMHADADYADFTTASPDTMQHLAQVAATQGRRFTDVAIMGAIFIQGAGTPLLCAGTGAQRVAEFMASTGAPARAIDGVAGDAMTLKLLRSIITKGLESLSVECLVAADRKNLVPALFEVLADVDERPLTTFMQAMVRSHVVHAERRLVEVQEARQQLHDDALEPLVLDGVERLFARTASALATQRGERTAAIPDSLQSCLTWLAPLAQRA